MHRSDTFLHPYLWTRTSIELGCAFSEEAGEAALTLMFLENLGLRNQISGVKAVTKLTVELAKDRTFRDLLKAFAGTADWIDESSNVDRSGNYDKSGEQSINSSSNLDVRYSSFLHAFRHLEVLALSCLDVQDEREVCDSRKAREVQEVLGHARELRVLDLKSSICNVERVIKKNIPLNYTLSPFLSSPTVNFPHLRHLRISASLNGHALASFTILYSKKLKRLYICSSFGDNWEVVLRTIARELVLDHLYIHDVHELDRPGRNEPWAVCRPNLFYGWLHHWGDFGRAVKAFFASDRSGALPPEYYEQGPLYDYSSR